MPTYRPDPSAVTVQSVVNEAIDVFSLARLDAELIVAHGLGKSRSWLYAWPEKPVAADAYQTIRVLLQRRADGEPLAYLTGEKEFYGLPLRVTADTLIPRPETELMVDTLLQLQQKHPMRRILDLGTGSGAIALALAAKLPACQITATDSSPAALTVARENARRLGLKVNFACGHWFAALESKTPPFSAILSNPPYIADQDPHLTALRHEPTRALVADGDGLADLFHLIEKAPEHLQAGGWLLLEHGQDQAAAVRERLAEGGFRDIQTQQDLAGLDRISLGRRPS